MSKDKIPGEVQIEAVFSDFENFADTVRAWNLDFHQLEKGALSAHLRQRAIPRFSVGESHISRAMEQHGAAPPGMRTFVVAGSNSTPFRWRGFEVSGHELLIFPRSQELYCVSKRGFHNQCYSIDEDALCEVANAMGCEEMESFLDSGVEVVRLNSFYLASLREMMHGILHPDAGGLILKESMSAKEFLEWEMACLLVKAIVDGAPLRRSRPALSARSIAIRKAMDLVNDSRNYPVTVQTICRETGVKERTLQYAFQEEFGVGPKQWLKFRNLGQVRKELHRADPKEVRISDVANKWGIWHMGQFAKDYRSVFDELPSETLRRNGGL